MIHMLIDDLLLLPKQNRDSDNVRSLKPHCLASTHLKSFPSLDPNLTFVGDGAASPATRGSTWNLGALTLSSRSICGCRGVCSSNALLSGDCEADDGSECVCL